MAIKISNNTIIDDSRNLINATSVGIGTTNATSELTVSGDVLVNNIEILEQTDCYGILTSHQQLNSYGLLRSTGSTEFSSINDGPLAGFKNPIINGGFDVWQRSPIGITTISGTFGRLADKWNWDTDRTGVTVTTSQEEFTPGQTEVLGNPKYYLRMDKSGGTGGTYEILYHLIEGVETFAGQEVTFSFYAKASSTIELEKLRYTQNFGTGGSGQVDVLFFNQAIEVNTNWQKYTYTFTINSISGKTVGPNNRLVISFFLPYASSYTLDLAQIQLEPGPVATPFETRSLAIEYDLCRRYYQTGDINEGGSAALLDAAPGGGTGLLNSIHYFSPSMYETPSVTILGTVAYNINGEVTSLAVSNITKNQFTTTVSVSEDLPFRAYNWSWEATTFLM